MGRYVIAFYGQSQVRKLVYIKKMNSYYTALGSDERHMAKLSSEYLGYIFKS